MSMIPTFEFRSPEDSPLEFEISWIEHKPILQMASQKPRRDNFYIIFFITGGQGTYFIDFEQYPIQHGMMFCIAPHQVHYWQVQTPISGNVLIFTENLLTTNLAYNATRFPEDFSIFNWETPAGFLIPETYERRFHSLTHVLIDEYQLTTSLYRTLAIQSALLLLLINAQRAFDGEIVAEPSAGAILVQQFLALVNTHYNSINNVTAYAHKLGITSGHLSDTMSEMTGQSPLAIIHRRIVLESKRLLIHTDASISAIAETLSFTDPSYFGRFFKRHVDATPNEFRNRFR